jgi:hypothetical protein
MRDQMDLGWFIRFRILTRLTGAVSLLFCSMSLFKDQSKAQVQSLLM